MFRRMIGKVLISVAAAVIQGSVLAGPLEDGIRSADQILNRNYERLMEKLSAEQKTALRQAQREWVRFRDAECEYESKARVGGSDDWVGKQTTPKLDPSCVYSMTSQRATLLSQRLLKLDPDAGPTVAPSMGSSMGARTPSRQPLAQSPLPEASATMSASCHLDKLPRDFTVQAVGVYEGNVDTDVRLEASGHETKAVDVIVNMPGKDLVLVLTAYDPVLWRVKRSAASRIAAVIVGGYHTQAVLGIDRSVPLLISTHEGRKDCERAFYAYEAGPNLLEADTQIKKLTGRGIDHLYGSYKSSTVLVGDTVPAGVTLVSSSDYQAEDYTTLMPFPSGQKGIDRLIELGMLRRATDEDLNTWVEKASAKYRKFNSTLSVSKPFGPQGVYTVLRKMPYPEGLFGAHSVAFLIPPGVPTPDGDPGHCSVYYLGTGECRGPGCQEGR